jgi:hypothetical protein
MKTTTRRLLTACTLSALCAGAAHAQTNFTGAVDTDFNNPANWDNGAPDFVVTGDPALIPTGQSATLTANYLMKNNTSPSVTYI